MREFVPDAIYYEEKVKEYELGKELLEKYKDVPEFLIENHNNIEEMRKKENKEFPRMKRNLFWEFERRTNLCLTTKYQITWCHILHQVVLLCACTAI